MYWVRVRVSNAIQVWLRGASVCTVWDNTLHVHSLCVFFACLLIVGTLTYTHTHHTQMLHSTHTTHTHTTQMLHSTHTTHIHTTHTHHTDTHTHTPHTPHTHTHHTHTHHTGGAPSSGGDYITDIGNFIFSTGINRVCLDVFVFRDNIYEVTEDLTVEVSGFINSEGSQVPGLSGVTVVRDMSTIQIMDLNGEWVWSCVTMATVS